MAKVASNGVAIMKVILTLELFHLISAQPEINSKVNVESLRGERCYRDCRNTTALICYFDWHLEHYHVLGPACGKCGNLDVGPTEDCFNDQCITADGFERGVMSINRKIPGPPIHVCKNDLIVVDVTNKMGGTSVAIHWHGFYQRKTPYFDGVPYVTQCPIQYSSTFRYAFEASEPGTQFYHSHSGHHKVNGHYGGIVVRQNPIDEPNHDTYDQDLKEHLIVASDWMETYGELFMPGLRSSPIGIGPSNLLINGKGTRHNKTSGRSITGTPLEVFRVQRGQRYRFRFVNSLSHSCPAVLEVENHSLLMIASDSFSFQPVSVDSFVSTSGERYDFVINANQTGAEMFWIRLKALGLCEAEKMQQFAVLSYEPSPVSSIDLAFPYRRFPDYSKKFGNGGSLNHPNTTCGPGELNNLCITDLTSFVEQPDITEVVISPVNKFCLAFSIYPLGLKDVFAENKYEHFLSLTSDRVSVGAINNISMVFPPFSPLTQPEEVKDSLFCDDLNVPQKCANQQICNCIHRIKVKKNSIVELTVVDESTNISTINHPFHLHGHKLFVMDMGQHPDKIPMTCQLAKEKAFQHRFSRASVKKHVIKDTISIPSKGFTVFRFKADNPGWWLLHCHFEWHMAVGMGLVLQVGETSEMVKAPANFPKCNNYKPTINNGMAG